MNGLADERKKTGASMSPAEKTTLRRASIAHAATR
jgi:hypothetical protein